MHQTKPSQNRDKRASLQQTGKNDQIKPKGEDNRTGTNAKTKQTTGINGKQTGRPNGKTEDEPTVNGTRGLTKRGTVEPEPAGPDEKLPNLTGGTTAGLGQTGETEMGQAKFPTGLERAD